MTLSGGANSQKNVQNEKDCLHALSNTRPIVEDYKKGLKTREESKVAVVNVGDSQHPIGLVQTPRALSYGGTLMARTASSTASREKQQGICILFHYRAM
jgi:hypothetical protein